MTSIQAKISPLLLAVNSKYSEISLALIENGGDLSATMPSGETLRYLAQKHGLKRVLQAIRQRHDRFQSETVESMGSKHDEL